MVRSGPAAEVPIDTSLVSDLIRSQFPQWSGLALTDIGSPGWDNAVYRLGSDLSVRLPRRQMGADQVEQELRWLPKVAPHLHLEVPVPVGAGRPSADYPWHWSVRRWVAGDVASSVPFDDDVAAAHALARFIGDLRSIEPGQGAPRAKYRGGPLASRDEVTRAGFGRLGTTFDVASLDAIWRHALGLPAWEGEGAWMHGDLHPGNLLVRNRRLSGVIDFGLLAVGDPACDLMVAWTALTESGRNALRGLVSPGEAQWGRGRAWALAFGVACSANAADDPVLGPIGRATLREILSGK